MNSAGRSNISSIFQHGLQDGYLSLNPNVKGGLFPLRKQALHVTARDISHEPPKEKTNSGTTLTGRIISGQRKLH